MVTTQVGFFCGDSFLLKVEQRGSNVKTNHLFG